MAPIPKPGCQSPDDPDALDHALGLSRGEPRRRLVHVECLVPVAPHAAARRAQLLRRLAHVGAGGAPHRLAGRRERRLHCGGRALRLARPRRSRGDPVLVGGAARTARARAPQRGSGRERARVCARAELPRADRAGVGCPARDSRAARAPARALPAGRSRGRARGGSALRGGRRSAPAPRRLCATRRCRERSRAAPDPRRRLDDRPQAPAGPAVDAASGAGAAGSASPRTTGSPRAPPFPST